MKSLKLMAARQRCHPGAARSNFSGVVATRALWCLAVAFSFPLSTAAQVADSHFDLNSTERNNTAAVSGAVQLQVGDSVRTITSLDGLTDAEHIAVQQKIATGDQSILLGALGNAVGGTFNVHSDISGAIGSLVIPAGVTAIHDFGVSQLNITGNLSNSGNLFGISTNAAVQSGIISASNIFNQSGGLLTTVLPAGGLPGSTSPLASLNLTLNVVNNIVNAGVISSSGSLTAIAGGSITNVVQSVTGAASPIFTAVGNLNLQASNIVNQGLLASINSNINISTLVPSNFSLINTGGTVEALNGSINVRDSLASGVLDTLLSGGDFIARELNLFSGCGLVNVDARDIQGTVNIFGAQAHVNSATSSLNLGDIVLTGDPTFFNSLGDVLISGDLVFNGAPLAIVAAGSILSQTGAGRIDTSSTTGDAGAITLIAGAQFTTDGAPAAFGDSAATLTITGGSASGGHIDLSHITSMDSRSSAGNGGNITLAAFSGTSADSGSIALPQSVTVYSGGDSSSASGNVVVLGGSPTGVEITVGSIDTTGGSSGGDIKVVARSPVLDGSVFIEDGSIMIASGSILGGDLGPGAVTTGALTASGRSIEVTVYGNVLIKGAIANDAIGTADGGSVYLLAHTGSELLLDPSAAVSGVQGGISVRGGVVSGAGGSLEVVNAGPGGVRLTATNSIDVSPFEGRGGSVNILGLGGPVEGPVTIAAGIINGNAQGSGNHDGGYVAVAGADVVVTGGGTLLLSANAVGSGNGGAIATGTSGSMSDLIVGLAPGQIQISATGGATGSSGGNGGLIAVGAGHNLNVDPSAISASPLGKNGDGANILFGAGISGTGNLELLATSLLSTGTATNALTQLTLAGNGNLVVTGGLIADGIGSGNGGQILLGTVSNTPFLVGPEATTNGVVGSIFARPGATGIGGSVALLSLGTGGINPASANNISTGAGSKVSFERGLLIVSGGADGLTGVARLLNTNIGRLTSAFITSTRINTAEIRPRTSVGVRVAGPNRQTISATRIPNIVSRLANNLETAGPRSLANAEESAVQQEVHGSMLQEQDEVDRLNEIPDTAVELAQDAVVLHKKGKQIRTLLSSAGNELREIDGKVQLSGGVLFAHADSDAVVRSRIGWVEAIRGAVFAVEAQSSNLRVRACSGPGLIWVHAEGRRIPLAPGQEVLITDHRPKEEETSPDDSIGRRQIETVRMDRLSVTLSEFSIVSMMRSCPSLAALRRSDCSAEHRRLRDAMLRTAAAVHIVTSKHGRYYVASDSGSSSPQAFKQVGPGGLVARALETQQTGAR